MSSSLKRGGKRKYLQRTGEESTSNYIKHKIANTQKLQKLLSSFCDNDSSSQEDLRPFFLRSPDDNSDDNLSAEESNSRTKVGKKSLSCKASTKTTTDKHECIVKNSKGFCPNVMKEKAKSKEPESESDSISSISEGMIYAKHTGKRGKKHVITKSNRKGLFKLNKDDADSSSGKEFQKSKLTRANLNALKQLGHIREENAISTDSNSVSISQVDERTMISKKRSLQFKSRVVKILNKFKEACSEYELKMEHVKWKHFKKELIYQESADNIIKKSKNVISNFKMSLDAQEKELTDFYKEWYTNSSLKNTDTEDSSLSEDEVLTQIENTEKSEKLRSSPIAASVVSECDSKEIFSDTSVVSNSIKESSPILGGSKDKRTLSKISEKRTSNESDSSVESKECQGPEKTCIINESAIDIFDESTKENMDDDDDNAKQNKGSCENENNLKEKEVEDSDANKSQQSPGTEEQNRELDIKDSDKNEEENVESMGSKSVSPTEVSESSMTTEILRSNELETEEQIKEALLKSDSDTLNEDSSVEKSSKSMDSKLNEESKEISEKVKSTQKGRRGKEESDLILQDDSSSDEHEVSAKLALLESNSDNSMSPADDKKKDSDDKVEDTLAKEKLLVSSNTESSSSDSSIKSENSKANSSEKPKVQDFKRWTRSSKINCVEADEKLKMQLEVVLVRLSNNVLKKYKNSLDKSRHYLESKELRSLIDLHKLQRDWKTASESPAGAQSKKRTKAAKEGKDTLLNHIMEGEVGEGFLEHTEEDSSSENNISTVTAQSSIQTNEELIKEADAATKKLLLDSSDSDIGEQKDASQDSDREDENDKTLTKKIKMQNEKEDKDDNDDDKEGEDNWKKSKWRRNKLLTTNFSSDENSGGAREQWGLKQKKLREQEEENTDCSPAKDETPKLKRRSRKHILNSDSDVQLLESDSESDSFAALGGRNSDSDSSVGKHKKMRKRKTRKSSDTDSTVTERRSKPKRRRIKTMETDSDDSDSDQLNNSQGTPGKKGRKNIRRVMKDKQVAEDTKLAAKEEEERLKRISERQKLYNEMYEARLAGEEKVEKLVLDFDPDDKKELVTVHENLVKRLKPHQAKGIKFMWDACFESLERMKTSSGSGCIIAHCMGLGKTLQVITLVHTLLTHETTDIKTILIVCPLSTVLNWLNEFKLWLKDIENDIEVYEMTKMKKNIERKYQLESWQRTGGILIIGYEMFRNLTGASKNMRASMKEAILKYLIDPGPDMVVCDEGHLLKNEDTALSKSMKRIKTLRRIVLTGTPLQNNLTEYHCMVQFVKPSLLGTKREFLNRFANPITNGQFDDSTEYDVKLMKKRAYVLHKMLKGCVQRFDYSVLTPFLPPKQEYVIFVSLTEQQINLYRHYLDNFARKTRTATGSLFPDFQALQRIWTHPMVLKLNAEKLEKLNERKFISSDSEGSLKDFVVDDSDSESTSDTSTVDDDDDDDVKSVDSNAKPKNTKSNTRNNKLDIEVLPKPEEPEKKDEEWWLQFVKPEDFEDIRASAKLLLLFGILRECEKIGDKVLVFSQSLYSLTLIERFLDKIDNQTQEGTSSDCINNHTGSWSLGLDYFRLDGQTSAENRNIWCKVFNQPSNTRARLFLISTRAGGLGINLTAANRVIIFDASWNPSHDVQSIFRIYRFGQKKPCYVYRFLATGTMEEKIYNRQVTKLSLSCRVVDEQQIERHYSNHDLTELYTFEPNLSKEKPTLNLPKDRLLAELFLEYKDHVENYHEHDSLLENKAEEELNEEERKQAWLEYEEEKKGKPLLMPSHTVMGGIPNNLLLNQYSMQSSYNLSTDYEKLRELLQKDYPNATPETQQIMTTRVLSDMYSYWEQQAYMNVADHRPGQNAVVNQMQIRPQVPTMGRVSYVAQNTNQNISNQPNTYRVPDPRPTQADDDVVEIPSGTANNKNTNQEE